MKYRLLFLLFTCAILGSSCASLKVKTETPYRGSQVKKLAIAGTYFGRVSQPKLPLIDASAFNKKTNKISESIMSYQEDLLPMIEQKLTAELGKSLNIEIIKPSDFTSEQIETLKQKYPYRSHLGIDHDHYNVLLSTSEDINLFPFNNGEVLKHFDLSANYSRAVKDICAILEVDGLVINYNRLRVVSAGMFGMTGNIRLDTHVYIFDAMGRTIGKSEAYTKPIAIKGKKIEDYKSTYDQFPVIVNMLSKDIIKPKSSK